MSHLGIKVSDRVGRPVELTAAYESNHRDHCDYAMRVDGEFCAGISFMPHLQVSSAKDTAALYAEATKAGYLVAGIWYAAETNNFVKRSELVAVVGDLVYRRITAEEWWKMSGKQPPRRHRALYREVDSYWDVECLGPLGMKSWPNVTAEHLTDTVRELTKQISEQNIYENTPILADALQDTGHESELLSSLRSEGEPTSGSKRRWAVSVIINGVKLNASFKGAVLGSGDDLFSSADVG